VFAGKLRGQAAAIGYVWCAKRGASARYVMLASCSAGMLADGLAGALGKARKIT
jgi:hypothetical protein